jgi:CheY-like chemotaxis protein
MILLVEDEGADVFLMERAMKKAQLSLPMHNVKNGKEAIEYLQAAGKFHDRSLYPIPSIIFLDIKMPFMNGFEVLNWIKGQPSFNNIPVMMLTSSLEESDRQRAEVLGAKGFFIKPPTPEKLREIFGSLPDTGSRN